MKVHRPILRWGGGKWCIVQMPLHGPYVERPL